MRNQFVMLLVMLLVLSCHSASKLSKVGIDIKQGSDLFYEVRSGGQTYSFNVHITQYQEYIAFDYSLGDNVEGSIFIEESALENATNLYNYYGDGYEDLRDETSVWISAKLFKDLKSGKSVEIGLGNNVRETFTMKGSETYSYGDKGDGVPYNIPVFVITTKNDEKQI